MKSFGRMILSLFALCLLLFVFAYFFSPQVRTALTDQAGTSSVGQLKSNSELKSPGQQSGDRTGERAPASNDNQQPQPQ